MEQGWFYELSVSRLWKKQANRWRYYTYLPSRSRSQFFDATGLTSEQTPVCLQMHRAVVVPRGTRLLLAGCDTFATSPHKLRGLDQLHHSQMAKDWNLQLRTVGKLSDLKQDIKQRHGYVVSDGSYSMEAGAAAWIIEGRSATSRLIGTMITPSSPKDHSSFRSELTGLYGALCTLEALDLGDTTYTCHIACDGKSALAQITSTHPILPTEPHADLLQAIRTKAGQPGLTVQWRHVKGHQDGTTPTVLTRDAWLNIEADLLAKATVNPAISSPVHYCLPGEGWTCGINQNRVVKQLADTLHNHINKVPIKKHWKKKFQMAEDTWQLVDWEGVGRASHESSNAVRRWATKHTSGFFAQGKICSDGTSDLPPVAHDAASDSRTKTILPNALRQKPV